VRDFVGDVLETTGFRNGKLIARVFGPECRKGGLERGPEVGTIEARERVVSADGPARIPPYGSDIMAVWSDVQDFVREGVPLAPFTWFRLGGTAQYFAEPRSVAELATVVRKCREESLPVRVLGGGSNLLIRDGLLPGLVLRLSDPVFAEIKVADRVLTAGGGAKLGQVISAAVGAGLSGLENLVGIPGTLGGALHGNAGGRSGDIGQWTHQATVLSRAGDVHVRKREELVFAYRESSLDDLVILSAEFRLEAEDPQELTRRMQKQWIMTKATQPAGDQGLGCIFKNYQGMHAGALIDQADLLGARVGGAELCDRHPNFIVVRPGGTSDDVLRLIQQIKEQVADRLGFELELQLQVW